MAPLIAACAVSTIATIIDLKQRRIPHWLTLPTLVIALLFHAFAATAETSLLGALLGALLAAVLFFPMYWLGGIGGGDALLATALGALMGNASQAARLLLFTTLAGAVYALFAAARRGQLTLVWKRLLSKETRAHTEAITFAYAPAFLLGNLALLITLIRERVLN